MISDIRVTLLIFMIPVMNRVEYPWSQANDPANPNQIQTLFNNKCVSCHNETTNGSGPQEFYTVASANEITGDAYSYMIPRLDLSDRPITVTYDRETHEWPASYVSIFYPAALEMESWSRCGGASPDRCSNRCGSSPARAPVPSRPAIAIG